MDLVIDARKIRDYGIGIYIQNLALGIEGKIDVGYLCYPEDRSLLPSRCWSVRSRGYSLREQWEIWRKLARIPHRIFHSPHYVVPILYRGKLVVTVHDIIHILFPKFFPKGAFFYAKFMLSAAVKKASVIITVSETSMRDIISHFPGAEGKIRVVHNGMNPVFFSKPSEERLEWAKGFSPYILAVGNLKPHKRFSLLLKTFARIRGEFPELKLLIAGWKGKAGEGVVTLGKVPIRDLAALYHEALVLVHPSLYEGFGFPPFEASLYGVPVVSSRVGAVEEVLGGGVFYFDGEELYPVLKYVLENYEQARERARRARERAATLTPERFAREHLEIYRGIL